jgi:hypothetical protein
VVGAAAVVAVIVAAAANAAEVVAAAFAFASAGGMAAAAAWCSAATLGAAACALDSLSPRCTLRTVSRLHLLVLRCWWCGALAGVATRARRRATLSQRGVGWPDEVTRLSETGRENVPRHSEDDDASEHTIGLESAGLARATEATSIFARSETRQAWEAPRPRRPSCSTAHRIPFVKLIAGPTPLDARSGRVSTPSRSDRLGAAQSRDRARDSDGCSTLDIDVTKLSSTLRM